MRKSMATLLVGAVFATFAHFAHADTVTTFNVDGTATNQLSESLGTCASGATCSFSGTLGVDVTSGAVTAENITLPGLSAFDDVTASMSEGSNRWYLVAYDSTGDQDLRLDILTAPGSSLVGFTGGTFSQNAVINQESGDGFSDGETLYADVTGSIAAPSPVPLPGSAWLMLSGLGGLGMLARKRKAA